MSLGPFYQPVSEAPPWNWNPGETFSRAFNDAQENRRAQEKAELDSWMTQTLFPLKQQQAKLELEKLQQEVERGTLLTQKIREAGKVAHQGIMQGIQNPPSPAQQQSNAVYQSQFGFGRKIAGSQQPPQKRTLGSGLNPK